MEINKNSPANPVQGTTQQSAVQQKAIAQSWQVGQQLKAVVVESSQNSVKLRVDNALIQAPTSKSHQRGESVLLTVIRSGDKPVLRLQASPSAATEKLQAIQQNALKVLLPRQAPLTPLLANLSLISSLKSQLAAPLTTEISNSVKKLLDNIIPVEKAGDPKELRRAIADAGLLLEKKLATLAQNSDRGTKQNTLPNSSPPANHTQPAPLSRDFKANLLQLLEVLRQTPPRQEGAAKIPLPLQPAETKLFPASLENTNQPRLTTQSAKESLIRLLTAPPSSIQNEEGKNSALPSRLTEFSALLGRLPIPFFRHLPLQPQKAQLPTLALLQHRDQLIAELIRQVESTIARVQLSQLASSPQEGNTPPSWTFELPLRNGENIDVVQLRIEQETSQDDDDEKEARWRVTLTLDLPNIGTLYADITVFGEHATTTLWAEKPETAQLIDDNLMLLRDALEEQGIQAGEIRCQHGTPPTPPRQQRHTVLVDTRV